MAESDTGIDKLVVVDNKSLYYALDEVLAKLLMLLAVRGEEGIVKVVHYSVPVSEGLKEMLADKYTCESQFASLAF